MPEIGKDSPGVIAPPPLIYGAGLALGFLLDYIAPLSIFPDALQYAFGFALIVAAFAVVLPVILRFRDAGTHLDVRKPTTALVTSGPFRYSRNPAYVALTLLYAGIGIAADNLWALGLLLPVLLVMQFGVIRREERYLERKFGADYVTYKGRVRRWL